MDEDLKIVLTSELEADEEASAQRISAQLPNIAKLINSKSSIKVGVPSTLWEDQRRNLCSTRSFHKTKSRLIYPPVRPVLR